MSSYPELLDHHLGAAYKAQVVDKLPVAVAVKPLKDVLSGDHDLRVEARKRIQTLSGIEDRRCFISMTHRDLLKAALEGMND